MDRGDNSGARSLFQQALQMNSRHAWSHYGMAYVADREGNASAAASSACKADSYAGGDVDLKRELTVMIKRLNASCSG